MKVSSVVFSDVNTVEVDTAELDESLESKQMLVKTTNHAGRRGKLTAKIPGSALSGTACQRILVATVALLLMLEGAIAADGAGVVQLWAKLKAKSNVPTVKQIAPYHEALIVYEWEVTNVEKGHFDGKRLRVAHWVVFDKVVQSPAAWKVGEKQRLLLRPFAADESLKKICQRDTLDVDVDVPFYYDVGQALAPPSEEVLAGRMTTEVNRMLPHRLHVKLVALGDSRVAGGVYTKLFYADEKHPVPVAYNLAIGGAGMPDCELGVRAAVRHCPNLEWVVLGLGPRMVSAGWPVRHALAGPPWPDLPKDKASAPAIGKAPRSASLEISPGARSQPMKHLWEPGVENWALFETMVRELNRRDINILVFLPLWKNSDVAARRLDGGTPMHTARGLRMRLRSMAMMYQNFYFVDTLEMRTYDKKWTEMLEQYRRAPTWAGLVDIQQFTPAHWPWGALRPGAKQFHDSLEWERHNNVPEVLRNLPVLKPGRKNFPEKVSFRVDRPATIYLAIPPDAVAKIPELSSFKKTNKTLDGALLYRKDVPAGQVNLGFPHQRGRSKQKIFVAVGPRESEEKAP